MTKTAILFLCLILTVPQLRVTPEASPQANSPSMVHLLPAASNVGDGWMISKKVTPVASQEAPFIDGVTAIYLGPSGQRATISILRNSQGREAMYSAWSATASWFRAVLNVWNFEFDPARQEEMEGNKIPPGVADAIRIDGQVRYYEVPMCVSGYAIDPDLTVRVLFEGTIDGVSAQFNSCDRVAELIANAL